MESSRSRQALIDQGSSARAQVVALELEAEASGVTIEREAPRVWSSVRDAWRARSMLPQLGARFLAKFIQGTRLGRLWVVIRPFLDALGKTLLFGGVLKLAVPGGTPYVVFLLAGLLGWRLFERSLMYASRSFGVYRKLMKSIYFPLLLVPLAGMTYPAVEIAVYSLVFFGAVAFYWVADGSLYLQAPPQLLLVVPGLVLLLATTVGLSLWVAVLNAKARDVRYMLRYVLPVWLYATPVVYSPHTLPRDFRWLATVNPLSAPVEMIRGGLIGSTQISAPSVAWSALFGALAMLSGLWYFVREAARSIEVEVRMDDEDDDQEA